eukprot:snap_masked-scaffold_13-processed-gene-9.32-mRNA-1 protein AED:1.00 eAED:1.00 QI:0/0/0/0/1/1/2/0/348
MKNHTEQDLSNEFARIIWGSKSKKELIFKSLKVTSRILSDKVQELEEHKHQIISGESFDLKQLRCDNKTINEVFEKQPEFSLLLFCLGFVKVTQPKEFKDLNHKEKEGTFIPKEKVYKFKLSKETYQQTLNILKKIVSNMNHNILKNNLREKNYQKIRIKFAGFRNIFQVLLKRETFDVLFHQEETLDDLKNFIENIIPKSYKKETDKFKVTPASSSPKQNELGFSQTSRKIKALNIFRTTLLVTKISMETSLVEIEQTSKVEEHENKKDREIKKYRDRKREKALAEKARFDALEAFKQDRAAVQAKQDRTKVFDLVHMKFMWVTTASAGVDDKFIKVCVFCGLCCDV